VLLFVLCTPVFWRKEIARLKHIYKPASQLDPPPEVELAGGFLFQRENEVFQRICVNDRIHFEEKN